MPEPPSPGVARRFDRAEGDGGPDARPPNEPAEVPEPPPADVPVPEGRPDPGAAGSGPRATPWGSSPPASPEITSPVARGAGWGAAPGPYPGGPIAGGNPTAPYAYPVPSWNGTPLPPQYGTPPPAPYGTPARRRPRRRTVIAVVLAAMLLVAAAGVGVVLHDRSTRTVALLMADEPGDDPFTPTLVQDGSLIPTVRFDGRANRTPAGNLDGLHLGSFGSSGCNRAQLVSVLGGNPALATAWATPLGIGAPAVSGYVAGLTPVRLRADTRLTAHRNSGGRAQPYAATLEAGTAVLVDDRGLPRVRCADGAPLTGAQPLADPVHGRGWGGFDPANVIEIRPAAFKIVEFGLVDTAGEQPFRRPVGTTGDEDLAALPGTGRLDGRYVLTGTQTRCEGLVGCANLAPLDFVSRFTGCPDACTVSDPELGEGVPLTRDGARWRAAGTVPTRARFATCDGVMQPSYAFTTTFAVTESKVVDGVWTATRVKADHEERLPETARCNAVLITWTLEGTPG